MTDVEPTGAAGIEEEDLEDGEIESDEDDVEQKPVETPVAPPKPAPIVTASKHMSKPVESSRHVDPSPPKKSKPSKVLPGDEQEDFATSLERQLAQALGKPVPTSPVHDEDGKLPKEDRGGGGPKKEKNRKRRRRNESPLSRERESRQEKTRKVCQVNFIIGI